MLKKWIREFWPPVVALSLIALFGVVVWWTQRPADTITAGNQVAPSTVTLSPESEPAPVVRGTVTGPDGEPLVGVKVRLVGAGGRGPNGNVDGPQWETTTGVDGTYAFTDTSGGVGLRVLFAPDGEKWATTWHDEAWRPDDQKPLSGPVDGEFRVDVSLLPAAAIAGTVQGATTEYAVALERRVAGRWTEIQRTAERQGDRAYRFRGLTPGLHRVVVSSRVSGLVYAPAAVRAKDAGTTRVDKGETISGVDLTVPPPVVVTGRLVTSTGVPLADREITFHAGWVSPGPRSNPSEADPRPVRTDAVGRFRIELGTGEWYAGIGNRCPSPGSDPWLRVAAGGEPVQRNVVHDGVGSVAGKVTGPNGKPRRDVQISFVRRGAACGSSVTSNRKGAFRASDLEPGTYDVEYVWNTARGQVRETREFSLGLFEDRTGVAAVLR